MCNHRVRFYDHESFLLDKVVEFVAPALERGDGAVVVATAAHLRQLKELLAADGAEPPRNLCLADAEETLAVFMVDGLPDAQRFAAVVSPLLARASAGGGRRVAVFGEMVALLFAQGSADAALRLEKLWDGLLAAGGVEFDLLCAYPMSAFADRTHRAAFDAVCGAHAQVDAPERFEDALPDADRLHRLFARLQQAADSLEREVARRRRGELLLGRQAARISAMERAQAALKDLAGHDALTGLCNRRAFTGHLSQAIAKARRSRTGAALLFVDLDDFKALNDRLGHDAGDRLLAEAGERLRRCVRACDTVSRLGGDEFTIVMENADAAEAALLAQRVIDALAQRSGVAGATGLKASVGVGLYPDDAGDAEALLRHADRAMYRAKAMGKGRWAESRGMAAAPEVVPEPEGGEGATAWLTVEDAAQQLHLSRPHVVKLIYERRFTNVVHRQHGLPLIAAEDVSRVGCELRQEGRSAVAAP